jgi:ElaB/YqjD/DUF883 family membrane-anchored ribosome-binding protein
MVSSADISHPSAANPRAVDNRGMPGTAAMDTASPGASGSSTGPTPSAGTQPGDDVFGRVVQGAHETIDRLAEGAAPHVHRLHESVASASDQLHHRADQARELGDEWTESLRCTVREHPLAAVATAVAVGVLLARVTQR